MGFISQLKKKLGAINKSEAVVPATTFKQRRLHVRYDIGDRDLCTIEVANSGSFRIVNLCFNACLVDGGPNLQLVAADVGKVAILRTLGEEVSFEVKEILSRTGGLWVIIFNHNDERSLLALSRIIELLRCGHSAVAASQISAENNGKILSKARFTGDGPFDLSIERDQQGSIQSAMVTIRRGNVYCSVQWEAGRLVTKRSVDQQGVGARMLQTAEVDVEVVSMASLACLGMKYPVGPETARLFKPWAEKNKHSA